MTGAMQFVVQEAALTMGSAFSNMASFTPRTIMGVSSLGGAVMMTGLDWQSVLQALRVLLTQKRGSDRTLDIVKDYDVANVSEKVVRIIMSYTGYVNRTVWRREG